MRTLTNYGDGLFYSYLIILKYFLLFFSDISWLHLNWLNISIASLIIHSTIPHNVLALYIQVCAKNISKVILQYSFLTILITPTVMTISDIIFKLCPIYPEYSATYIFSNLLRGRRPHSNCVSSNRVQQLSQSVCIGVTLSFGWLG